jgi:glycosyltransferase involved in cell wall biosynthesis
MTVARVSAVVGTAGVDLAALPAAARTICRVPGPAGAPLRLLFLGRFEAMKGGDLLIEALRLLGREDIELVMAGRGHEEASLIAAASRLRCGVRFPGVLLGNSRVEAVHNADIVVVPSRRTRIGRSEGLPHAALVALANGVPVLSSGGGALEALLSSSGAGVVFDASGGAARAARRLSDVIADLLEKPDLRARLTSAAVLAGTAFQTEQAVPAWDCILRDAARSFEPEESIRRDLSVRTAS